ncbi:glycosyltransferase family 4 protein [Paracoccus hibiscisoli]|uniref:glycosyltransferase family 4 protein n=1 Tax=Paracoccus hibiscisoli TaxID=2023261 RepID=UPI0023EF7006|nr:glycosyltransferase family 4 protein [Paracoccus hibiscisoli]
MTARIPASAPRILFIHLSGAGQFQFLGAWLAAQGWDVTFLHGGVDTATTSEGIRTRRFRLRDTTIPDGDFRHILDHAAQNCRGATEMMFQMRHTEGYMPDIVMAHAGWGVGLGVKLVWPDCRYIAYHEWYYTDRNWDKGRAEKPVDVQTLIADRMRNLPITGEFDLADANWCPTRFQASRFPPALRRQITVNSDGVDCALHRPDAGAGIDFDWLRLPADRPVITYATRGMEPLRGFPQFLRAIQVLQQQRQDFDTVILANDSVSYGARLPRGDSWWMRMMDTLDLDHRRIHVNAMRPREEYVRTLQASTAHVYFTEPFVTSWSLSEALAMGCLVVGSNTAPVRELVEDMENGLIVEMDDAEEVAEALSWVLDNPDQAQALRQASRQGILSDHDAATVFPQKEALLRAMIAG